MSEPLYYTCNTAVRDKYSAIYFAFLETSIHKRVMGVTTGQLMMTFLNKLPPVYLYLQLFVDMQGFCFSFPFSDSTRHYHTVTYRVEVQ